MESKHKETYIAPEVTVIAVRMESGLLTLSGGRYPEWEEENI